MPIWKKAWIGSMIAFFLLSALGVKDGVSQEAYPNRPVTMVVIFGPGMIDTVMRVLCKPAEKELGQPIMIENKPGAAGTIGTNYVLKAKPDGYTLGAVGTGNCTIHPHLKNLAYNPLTDVVDVVTVIRYPFGIAVRKDAPWNTFEEVIAYAKNNPGQFTYATAGYGIVQHICMERIALQEGIKWTVVPFKSGAESVASCLGGHTNATVQGPLDVIPHIKAGKLKLLLAIDGKRWGALPQVPNILEKGYNFFANSYFAVSTPKGVPENILKKVGEAFSKAKKDPSFLQTLETFSVEAPTMSGKEYTEMWKKEYYTMSEVIKTLGLQEK
jgi:tripartite-type tricarboxylate transporter receptor subunit TctC